MKAPMQCIGDSTITPDRIMQLGFGFWASKALLSAIELDVFSTLAAGSLGCDELRRHLCIHERGARDFFDALVALGMLERRAGLYANTPETNFNLDRNKRSYIGGLLDHADTTLYEMWGGLTEALRTGQPRTARVDSDNPFAVAYADPAFLSGFTQAMTGASIPVARVLADHFPWQDYQTVIDVGTAEGAAPVEICHRHPHISGGGFDLPPVRPIFEDYVQRHGLADRIRFYPGDFFREPLPSADVLTMGHILHDWDLRTKRDLLAKAHAALKPGGALIVYDQMIDDDRQKNASGLLMSLNMLVATSGGFDYTGGECVNWVREAGFSDVRLEHLFGPYSMVVATK